MAAATRLIVAISRYEPVEMEAALLENTKVYAAFSAGDALKMHATDPPEGAEFHVKIIGTAEVQV